MERIINTLKEEISSIWTLLNDTEIFLNRINKFGDYEKEIREWRNTIQSNINNSEIRIIIKKEIINLRKSLRLQGYDLKLGSKDIKFYGFRSDDAVKEGFKRIVLAVKKDDIVYITGDENHRELMDILSMKYGYSEVSSIGEVHSLWYRWKDNILQLCGADSETKEEFERIIKFVENNKNLVLKKLKNIF